MTPAPLPATVPIVSFAAPAATTTRPRAWAPSWPQLARRLTRHERRADKDGAGWSPAVYRRDARGRLLTRRNDAVEAVTCAVGDFDTLTLDELAALLEHVKSLGLAGVVYSTFSHASTAPKVRLVVPFAESVPAQLWRRLWPTLNTRVWLGLADPAASDPGRMYYLPATPGDETTIADAWDGAALDWQALPLAAVDETTTAPVMTTGRGAAERVEPDDMPILERMFSGRDGARLMRIWGGDTADFDGNESRADMRLMGALAFYTGRDAARIERIARCGPWRPKWDERRRDTTWLGYTIAKAIAGCRETDAPPELDQPDDEPTTLAAALGVIRRLRAEKAGQMTVVRHQRARLDVLEPLIAYMDDVISRPEYTIDPDDPDGKRKIKSGPTSDDKLTAIAVARWLPSYRARKDANDEPRSVSLGYLEKVMGMPRARISASLHRQADADPERGAPWRTVVLRQLKVDDAGRPVLDPRTGKPAIESSLEVIPHGDTKAMLRAAATYTLPVLPTHGGSLEASDARWGRCARHPKARVTLEGRCAVDGELLGRRQISPETFERLNLQLEDSEDTIPGYVSTGYLVERQVDDSDEPDDLNLQLEDSGFDSKKTSRHARLAARVGDDGYGDTGGPRSGEAPSFADIPDDAAWDDPPTRCPAPDCRALEFRQIADGSWRCLRSGHDPSAYVLAVMGGEA